MDRADVDSECHSAWRANFKRVSNPDEFLGTALKHCFGMRSVFARIRFYYSSNPIEER